MSISLPQVASPLSELQPGTMAIVDSLDMEAADAALLRAMGLGCSCHVKLCRAGHPCIVAVLTEMAGAQETCESAQDSRAAGFSCCSSRIGLAQELAKRVMVRLVDSTGQSAPSTSGQ